MLILCLQSPFVYNLSYIIIFTCVDPDLYSEYGSRSTKVLNTDPICIRIHNTELKDNARNQISSWIGRKESSSLTCRWWCRLNTSPSAVNLGSELCWVLMKVASSPTVSQVSVDTCRHRRRINTEGKAKVVAAAWGQNCFNPCRASYFVIRRFEEWDELHQDDLKKMMNSSNSSNRPSAKQLSRQGIESIPFPKQQRRPLSFLLYVSFFYACRPK